MTNVNNTTVVGVFTNQLLAEHALNDLQRAGFTDEQIGFAVRAKEAIAVSIAPTDPRAHARGATTGAVSGGVAGGLLSAAVALLIPGIGPALAGGVLAATLSGVVMGAFAGGMVGALQGMGVSEEEARYYERELETGRIIVTVDARDRKQEALDILQRNSAYDASTQPDEREATPPPSTRNVHNGHHDEYNPNIPFGATF